MKAIDIEFYQSELVIPPIQLQLEGKEQYLHHCRYQLNGMGIYFLTSRKFSIKFPN